MVEYHGFETVRLRECAVCCSNSGPIPTLRESCHSVLFSNMNEVKDKAKIETHLKLMPTQGKTPQKPTFWFSFLESTNMPPLTCLFLHSFQCMLARSTFSKDRRTASIGFTKKECLDHRALSCDPVDYHREKGKVSVTILTC